VLATLAPVIRDGRRIARRIRPDYTAALAQLAPVREVMRDLDQGDREARRMLDIFRALQEDWSDPYSRETAVVPAERVRAERPGPFLAEFDGAVNDR
jgi:hypothetical protein